DRETLRGTDTGVGRAGDRTDGRRQDLQSGPMGALGQGREALDERLGGGRWLTGHAGQADVVDAEVDQDVGPARDREHVAVEARQRVLADAVPQQPVAGDALVDHPAVTQAPVEEVHRAVVRVGGGADPFEPGVAERHDHRRAVRSEHVHSGDVQPALHLFPARDGGRVHLVAAADVRGLRGPAGAGGQPSLARQIEAEGQVGAGRDRQVHRVADDLFARRDGELAGAVDGEVGPPAWGRDGGGADGQRRPPVAVGQVDPQPLSAPGQVQHLPHRLISETARLVELDLLVRADHRAAEAGYPPHARSCLHGLLLWVLRNRSGYPRYCFDFEATTARAVTVATVLGIRSGTVRG